MKLESILSLTKIIVLFALCAVSAPSAARAAPPLTFVSDAGDYSYFSDNSLYFVDLDLPSEGPDSFRFYRYDRKLKNYRKTFTLPEQGYPILCDVRNDGTVAIHDSDANLLHTHDIDGNQLNSVAAEDCPGRNIYFNNPPVKVTEAGKKIARALLCRIPGDATFKKPHGKARVYDILYIRKRFPGGRILASVVDDRVSADLAKFEKYGEDGPMVLIKAPRNRKNYCVTSAITPRGVCSLSRDEYAIQYSTAFFTRYSLHTPGDTAANCDFQITQQNNTGLPLDMTEFAVDSLEGEYSDEKILSNFEAQPGKNSPAAFDFVFYAENVCGYVIKAKSKNPKLRTQSFGLGDLWCSHY